MNKIKKTIFILMSILFISPAFATDEVAKNEKSAAKLRDPAEFQKIIEEYKAYAATVPVEIRQEVIAYRKDVAKLNKQKKALYNKLSQAGQNYLKKEQQYKKKLPLNHKNLISTEDLTEVNAEQSEPVKK